MTSYIAILKYLRVLSRL